VGSLICGSAELIERARRWRKVTGGGMRQAGVLAAAGLYALEHHVQRLGEDHANATELARGLAAIPGLHVDLDGVHTNMVMVEVATERLTELAAFLAGQQVLIRPAPTMRLVTHLDVSTGDVRRVVAAFQRFFSA
jgi:threonine aldolase